MFKITINLLVLSLFITSSIASENVCSPSDTTKGYYCLDNELCVNGRCECKPGYTRLNNQCIKANSNPEPRIQPATSDDENTVHNHVAVAIVIPILLIIFLMGGFIIIKKYNLISWITNKINQRTTPYDEVMIGQEDDDPPLLGA